MLLVLFSIFSRNVPLLDSFTVVVVVVIIVVVNAFLLDSRRTTP